MVRGCCGEAVREVPPTEDEMKRIGFQLQVKQDRIGEYREHHRNVWPDMLDALRKHGWHNYSLFMRDDGMMFGYFEADESLEASLAGMETEEINAKWQEMLIPYFEALDGRPDESLVELEEVFHTD